MISKQIHYFTSVLLIGAAILTSCGEDDGGNGPGTSDDVLTADAGTAQSAMPGQEVTLDAGNSTGTNLSYEWEFSGPGSITLSDGSSVQSNSQITSDASFTFSAQVTGEYFFSLRVTSGNEFSQASVTVTVAGVIELTNLDATDGSSTLTLTDVNFDDSPDYIVNSVLTLPENGVIQLNDNIIIAFADGAGFKLAGNNSITTNSQAIFEPMSTGWKGILAEDNVDLSGSFIIDGAGASAFDGMEAAAINSVGSFTNNSFLQFKNSNGYDLIISDAAAELTSNGLSFSSQTPLKMPFRLIPGLIGASVEYPDDALITLSSDVNVQLSSSASTGFAMEVKSDILITGGLHVNSNILFSMSSGHHTLFMEENTSLISSNSFRVNGSSSSTLTITGQNDSKWNGLHLSGNNHLQHVIIKNAGANPISSGSIVGITEKASIYLNGSLDILKDATITDSGGYGIYVSSFGFLAGGTGGSPRYDNYTISNHVEPAISAQRNQAYHMSGGTFTLSTPENVAAIEVRNTSTPIPNNSTWNGLGEGNYYLFEGDLTVGNGSSNFTLNIGAGAHLKFNTDKKIFINSKATLTATGTAENPIVLDGVTSWAGVLVGGNTGPTIRSGNCSFDFVTVQNGGSTELELGASKTGIYVMTTGTLSFTNCTFKDNMGYGAILQSNSTVFDFKAAENNNTFSGNSIGDLEDNATDSDGDGIPDSAEAPGCKFNDRC
ncbi:MAG: hypothetical protein ABJG78_08210 [Cyclobacteriaceae bacterium]